MDKEFPIGMRRAAIALSIGLLVMGVVGMWTTVPKLFGQRGDIGGSSPLETEYYHYMSLMGNLSMIVLGYLTIYLYGQTKRTLGKAQVERTSAIAELEVAELPSPNIKEESEITLRETEDYAIEDAIQVVRFLKDMPQVNASFEQMSQVAPFHVSFMKEKVSGEGEDAPSIILYNPQEYAGIVGVFDGLGGSGAAKYRDNQGQVKTGAYIASRCVQTVVSFHFAEQKRNQIAAASWMRDHTLHNRLKGRITDALDRQLSELQPINANSMVRSKMKRDLPTTMACVYFVRTDVPNHSVTRADDEVISPPSVYSCQTIWAGDSRCYLLTPNQGLQQLTQDDTQISQDAFESIYDDAPMSNVISANGDFMLNHRITGHSAPFILCAATDGCFGYVDTPMHFEMMILAALAKARNEGDWQDILQQWIGYRAQDDTSIALIAVGWSDFRSLKLAFKTRGEYLLHEFIKPLDVMATSLERNQNQQQHLREQEEELKQKQSDMRLEMWKQYKTQYEQLLDTGNDAVDLDSTTRID